MQLQRTVHAIIRPGEQSGYVAECPELNAVTQGSTLDDVAANLREVVALALEGEQLEQLGLDFEIVSHDELDTGTCRAIFRQASRYIPEAELLPHFLAD